jgi:hypothetical protein
MKIIQAATLETELARREVLRCFKKIKKAIEDFTKEAEGSKEYSRKQAIEAFKCIDYEVEKQTAKWMWGDDKNQPWDEV